MKVLLSLIPLTLALFVFFGFHHLGSRPISADTAKRIKNPSATPTALVASKSITKAPAKKPPQKTTTKTKSAKKANPTPFTVQPKRTAEQSPKPAVESIPAKIAAQAAPLPAEKKAALVSENLQKLDRLHREFRQQLALPEHAAHRHWIHARLARADQGRVLRQLETADIPLLSLRDETLDDTLQLLTDLPGGIPVILQPGAEPATDTITLSVENTSLAGAIARVGELIGLTPVVDGVGVVFQPGTPTLTLDDLHQEWDDFRADVSIRRETIESLRAIVADLREKHNLSVASQERLRQLTRDRELMELYVDHKIMRIRAFAALGDKQLAAFLRKPAAINLLGRLVFAEGTLARLVLDVPKTDPERRAAQKTVDALAVELKVYANQARRQLRQDADDARKNLDGLLAEMEALLKEEIDAPDAVFLQLTTALQEHRLQTDLLQATLDALQQAGIRPADLPDADTILDALDRDADGFTNLDESRLGTDPDDPSSFFQTRVEAIGGNLALHWYCTKGCTYRVFKRAALENGDWGETTQYEHTAAEPGWVHWIDEAATGDEQAFYRLEALSTDQ